MTAGYGTAGPLNPLRCDGAKPDARIKQDIAIALQESRKMLWFSA